MRRSHTLFGAMAVCGLALFSVNAYAGTVYLNDSSGNLFAGDPTTATYALVGNSATAAGSAVAPGFGGFTDIDFAGGVLYGLDSNGILYTIDTTTAAATVVGATGINDGSLVGLAGDPSGNLWAGGNNNVYLLGPGAAAVGGGNAPYNSVTNPGGYVTEGDLDFDGGGNLWLTSATPNLGELFLINQVTGIGSDAGPLGFDNGSGIVPLGNVFGVAYDSDNGIFYGYDAAGTQFDINTADPSHSGTGLVSYNVTGEDGALLGAAFLAAPEPASFALGLTGLGLLLIGARRRRADAGKSL